MVLCPGAEIFAPGRPPGPLVATSLFVLTRCEHALPAMLVYPRITPSFTHCALTSRGESRMCPSWNRKATGVIASKVSRR